MRSKRLLVKRRSGFRAWVRETRFFFVWRPAVRTIPGLRRIPYPFPPAGHRPIRTTGLRGRRGRGHPAPWAAPGNGCANTRPGRNAPEAFEPICQGGDQQLGSGANRDRSSAQVKLKHCSQTHYDRGMPIAHRSEYTRNRAQGGLSGRRRRITTPWRVGSTGQSGGGIRPEAPPPASVIARANRVVRVQVLSLARSRLPLHVYVDDR